jgi:hypothetical protein
MAKVGVIKPLIYDGVDFRDPVQSTSINDCGLIAAMSAVAFNRQITFLEIKEEHPNVLGRYSFNFTPVTNQAPNGPTTVTISGRLWKDFGVRPLEGFELWPSLLEKAYYEYWSGMKYDASKPSDFADALAQVNPFTAVREISGMKDLRIFSDDDAGSWNEICEILDESCRRPTDGCPSTGDVKILRMNDLAIATTKSPSTPEEKRMFADNLLTLGHAYALLGVAEDGRILLRDPSADRGDRDKGTVIILADGEPLRVSLGKGAGVFLIGRSEFVACFKTLGWAYNDTN